MKQKISVFTQINKKRFLSKSTLYDIHPDRLKIIKSLLPEQGKLLEIGAWDGTTIRYYKSKFKGESYGIDISKDNFKFALKDFVELKECDLNYEKIPYEDNFFDVVVCGEVIEHIFDTDFLISEIYRVLKENGILIISTPNLSSFINKFLIFFGLQPIGTEVSMKNSQYGNKLRKKVVPAGHIRNFTYGALLDMLKYHNFKIIKKSSSSISHNVVIRFFESIFQFLWPSLGSDIIIKAKVNKI